MASSKTNNQSPLEALLGPKLLIDVKTSQKTSKLLNKPLVGLYFSASWCPPCKAFSPILKTFYQANKENIDIVFVSSDRSLEEFEAYYQTMPSWYAIPADAKAAEIKNDVATRLKIQGIPTLVILNAQGLFVTNRARQQVTNTSYANVSAAYQALVEEWKNTPAVPLAEADLAIKGQPPGNWIVGWITTLLKNPVYMLGLVYFFQWIRRQLQESGKIQD